MQRKKLVVGNWKMHGGKGFVEALLAELKSLGPWPSDVAVCPPALYLPQCELQHVHQQQQQQHQQQQQQQ